MMENEYAFNKHFREYVDQYCKEKGMTVEEALKDVQIKRAWMWLTEV